MQVDACSAAALERIAAARSWNRGAVRQARHRVIVGKLVDARLRLVVFDRDRAEVHACFDELALESAGPRRLGIERERGDDAAVARANRARPARRRPSGIASVCSRSRADRCRCR